jgi:hypothetical protein
MTTGLVESAALVWNARQKGGYKSVGGRFVIERRGLDWGLVERRKERVRLFGSLRDAKAGAEWVVSLPKAR